MTSSSPDPEAPAAPEAPAVRVRGLSVDLPPLGRPYAAPLHAVRDLSFTAPTGQVTALVGANGAGKTTTLRTLLGAVPHTTGQVEVLGTAMGPADVPAPAGVALVPDAPAYPARWTPQHLARAHLARETQVDSARFDPARFDARLTAHRIPAARPLHSLSRGQLTQLALAAALARDPQLLILDEPFAHLDPLARTELVDTLRELMIRPDRTVLLSTHDLEGMDRFVDRLVLIAQGTALLEGDVETLRDEFVLLELPATTPEEPGPQAASPLIGAVTAGGITRALVHVEEAAGLPPTASLQRPGLADLVTHWLRAADRQAVAHSRKGAA